MANELSLYASEDCTAKAASASGGWRWIDGFVSLRAPRPGRRAFDQAARLRRRQPGNQRIDVPEPGTPSRDGGPGLAGRRRLRVGRLPRMTGADSLELVVRWKQGATFGHCLARRSNCSSWLSDAGSTRSVRALPAGSGEFGRNGRVSAPARAAMPAARNPQSRCCPPRAVPRHCSSSRGEFAMIASSPCSTDRVPRSNSVEWGDRRVPRCSGCWCSVSRGRPIYRVSPSTS